MPSPARGEKPKKKPIIYLVLLVWALWIELVYKIGGSSIGFIDFVVNGN